MKFFKEKLLHTSLEYTAGVGGGAGTQHITVSIRRRAITVGVLAAVASLLCIQATCAEISLLVLILVGGFCLYHIQGSFLSEYQGPFFTRRDVPVLWLTAAKM